MIVCVLLVSNSLGCCLATGRQHPREFDTNNTNTIMFDPLNILHQQSCTPTPAPPPHHHHHHHHSLSCGSVPARPHSLIPVLIHSDHVFIGLPFPLGPCHNNCALIGLCSWLGGRGCERLVQLGCLVWYRRMLN